MVIKNKVKKIQNQEHEITWTNPKNGKKKRKGKKIYYKRDYDY